MSAPTKITLGSGKLYCTEYSGTVPETDTICTEANLLAYLKGGATLNYTPEFYEAKDDLGYVSKTILTTEEATLQCGIMTFNGNVLNKLVDTGSVSEDSVGKTRTLLIGGAGNSQRKSYVFCFHQEDPVDGDIWIVIVGQNQAGFSFAFTQDSESIIDAEIKALVQDSRGTLIKYIEEDKSITGE